VPGGEYKYLNIRGNCTVDDGNVTVDGDTTVFTNGALLAAFSGSDLSVGANLVVHWHGILILGCEPEAFPCFNEPTGVQPNWATNNHVYGSVFGDKPLMMLVHNNTIDGTISQSAGGGGRNCSTFPLGPDGPPAYSTYEDNDIGGGVAVVGIRTCWFGFIRNTVGQSVVLRDNYTADPDGNEVVSNTIAKDLRCRDNRPEAQIGDSGGSPNVVGRIAYGECASLT
jgi:hypothetical protein